MRTLPGWPDLEIYFRIVHLAHVGSNSTPVASYSEQAVEVALGPKGAFENVITGAPRLRAPPSRVVSAVPPSSPKPAREPKSLRVVELLRKAIEWQALLVSGTVATQSGIACQEGITRALVKGCARREGLNNSLSSEERVKMLEEVGKQRTRQARGEAVPLAAAIPDSPAQFTDKTPVLYRAGYEYYRTPRGEHPNATDRYVINSLARQMDFFPFDQIDTISPRPALFVAGLMLTPYITVRTGITGQ